MERWISVGRFEEVEADPGLEDQSHGNSSLTLESELTLNVKPKEDLLENEENSTKRWNFLKNHSFNGS
jgi:hypothetical protein